MARDLFDILQSKFGASLVEKASGTYLEEPRGRYASPDMPLVRPRNTQEVSEIVSFCNENKIAIVPYAGGTGLVGGQTKEDGEAIILSVERMNVLRDIYPNENVMVVEAGCILADVQNHAKEADRLFPLSLAAQGSCRIGGNLATNAGGVQVLRYGNARDLCLGIEAVMPDGSIHNGLRRLRKDNTGYDIRNLLIGSEGTLGIITAASLKLFERPKETVTAFLIVDDPVAAVNLLSMAQDKLSGLVSAFELIHKQGLDFLAQEMPEVRLPFDHHPEWSVLIEAGAGEGTNLEKHLMDVIEQASEEGMILDGVIAQSQSQADQYWSVRESIPEANRKVGSISSHDISIPISLIPEFIDKTPALIAKVCDIRINCFGHIGDGNLHYNFYPPLGKSAKDYVGFRTELKQVLHDQVHAFDGSISAEHGIGRLKVDDLTKYGDPAKLAAMRAIKTALDPNGIMNPGTIIPE